MGWLIVIVQTMTVVVEGRVLSCSDGGSMLAETSVDGLWDAGFEGNENLTYGQIHNLVVDPGIQVCTDFKLQNKIRKEKVTSKQEVGTFCQQYGIETIRAPSAIQKRKIRKQSKPINAYRKPYQNSR